LLNFGRSDGVPGSFGLDVGRGGDAAGSVGREGVRAGSVLALSTFSMASDSRRLAGSEAWIKLSSTAFLGRGSRCVTT